MWKKKLALEGEEIWVILWWQGNWFPWAEFVFCYESIWRWWEGERECRSIRQKSMNEEKVAEASEGKRMNAILWKQVISSSHYSTTKSIFSIGDRKSNSCFSKTISICYTKRTTPNTCWRPTASSWWAKMLSHFLLWVRKWFRWWWEIWRG